MITAPLRLLERAGELIERGGGPRATLRAVKRSRTICEGRRLILTHHGAKVALEPDAARTAGCRSNPLCAPRRARNDGQRLAVGAYMVLEGAMRDTQVVVMD